MATLLILGRVIFANLNWRIEETLYCFLRRNIWVGVACISWPPMVHYL